jgi:hypothetical protein
MMSVDTTLGPDFRQDGGGMAAGIFCVDITSMPCHAGNAETA